MSPVLYPLSVLPTSLSPRTAHGQRAYGGGTVDKGLRFVLQQISPRHHRLPVGSQ